MSDGEIQDLKNQIDALERRVTEIENKVGDSSVPAVEFGDQFDAKVLQILRQSDGDTFGLNQLKEAYRRAGVRNKTKITDRVRHLEASGVLESTAHMRWRLVVPDE